MNQVCKKCHNSLDESAFEIFCKDDDSYSAKFKRDEVCRGCRSWEKVKNNQ